MNREESSQDYIFGLRAIIEAIEAGKEIDKIFISKDLHGPLAAELVQKARQQHIVTLRVPVEKIDRITRRNHQGALALIAAVTYHSLGNLLPQIYEQGRVPFIVMLDGVTDVRNFGAIARTCECAGVDALVIPARGSVSVGPDAVKTSAGALLRLPVCREMSLASTVNFLKENGLKVIAVTEKASQNYTCCDYSDPIALVMGGEDRGISPEVLDGADERVRIPMAGHIGSLNVSVAAGIAIYQAVNQRNAGSC